MRRIVVALALAAIFLRELALSAWAVARLVVAPEGRPRPALLAVPLDLRRDGAIALFANMVTLTPGTTSIHVSADRRTLFVHAIDAPDPDATIADLKRVFETRIRTLME
jgi:multicomponent Na+:H+ antiporter subunit E